ncbi:MAG: DUF3160 domain-containing protein [Patescibacteria group bacterium]
MEDKKPLIIAAIIVVVLFIITAIGVFFFLSRPTTTSDITAPPNTNTDYNYLPPSLQTSGDTSIVQEEKIKLEKEKQFISSFWKPWELKYTAQSPTYKLPLDKTKEQVINYRDFSRKINLDPTLAKLTANGFVVINNPFDQKVNDWAGNYKLINNNKLPVLITADSVVGLYQDTLNIVYKEIEQEIFYPSLWQLLKEMANQARQRYESRQSQFGIKTDLVTEANRLELAFITTGLKLLQPETGQIKDSLSADNTFFSSQEAGLYTIATPPYLADEIAQEIKLIKSKAKTTKSPIFLYPRSYEIYAIPPQYNTSEKLKNYYLAITWLNNNLFPLWSKSNDCPKCLLDQSDQIINFVASLYLTNDLASDQALKNRWANIYKSISFFKGLEVNLTYLDYQQAMKDTFGKDYNLNNLFTGDQQVVKDNIINLQEKISSYNFSKILRQNQNSKEKAGLRLLRNYYLLENELFNNLSGQTAGQYTGQITKGQVLPFSTCQMDKKYYRCWPTGLDLFNLLNNETAKKINEKNKGNLYANYNQNLTDFSSALKEFTQPTWHDNAYLSLLSALTSFNQTKTGLPAFMQTDLWQKKELNTSLGAWVDFHREINFEKTKISINNTFREYFPYGYIEPQTELYSTLLANVDMVMSGFTSLQIISNQSKSFERLTNLKNILQPAAEISKKELTQESLTSDNYDFINNFYKQIETVIGDIKASGVQNKSSFSYATADNYIINEYLDGLNYLIVIYPDKDGKLYFAVGPVFSYLESKNKDKPLATWQQELKP